MKCFYLTIDRRIVACLLFLASLLILPETYAQERNKLIKGKVVDATNGEALPGVNVLIKGTSEGTTTDLDGAFTLKVANNDELQFSYIGYKTMTMSVSGKTEFNIELAVDQETLDEVIVVGYGTTSEKLVTTALASVDAEDIQSVSVGSVENAINGRIAGVNIIPTSGAPGSGIKVRVRGTGSNGNAEPLYIVDGMRVPNISFLDPLEIGSVDVLKDAASAAIYGAEGGNGVVYVTTKLGEKGKTKITYDFQHGIQSFNPRVNLMNVDQYDQYWSERGVTRADATGFETDWLDEVFNSANQQRHALTLSGGNDKTQYLISGNLFTQDGVIGGELASFERKSIRFNATHKLRDWLNVSHRTTYANYESSGINENNSFGGIAQSAILMDPGTPVVFGTSLPAYILNNPGFGANQAYQVDANGNYYGVSTMTTGEAVNPIAAMNNNTNRATNDLFFNVLELGVTPIKDLTINSRFGLGLLTGTSHRWQQSFYYSPTQQNTVPNSSSNVNRTMIYQWENWLNYTKSFDDHNFDLVAGTSAYSTKFTIVGGQGGPLFGESDELSYLSGIPNPLANTLAFGNESQVTLLSYYGRLQYNYNDRYLLGVTVRTDGSSLLSDGNRWGVFPSISAGWLVSNESFFNIDAINYAKVRASWGKNGSLSNLNPGSAIGLVSAVFQYTDADGNQIVGAEPTQLSNLELTWETSTQWNVGVDLGFLNDKVTFTADYFVKNTQDLLNPGTPPGYIGNFAPIVNSGDIQNKGLELALAYENNGGQLKYGFSGNFTKIVNKVTKINPNKLRENGANVANHWASATAMEEGFPIWYFRGYKTDGIFQSQEEVDAYTAGITGYNAAPGDPKIIDSNGDGQITPADFVELGSPHPDFTFGFNATAEYKGFDFRLFVQGSIGNDVLIGYVRNDVAGANYPDFFFTDRWTASNPTNDWFRSDANGLALSTDYMIQDGSFVKVRQLQIGYSLPSSLIGEKIFSKVRLYMSLDNFITFTKYEGFDPEIGGSASDNSIGIDRGIYPAPRVFLTGLTLHF